MLRVLAMHDTEPSRIRFDRVVIIEKGSVAEYGAPSDLLKNENGILTELVRRSVGASKSSGGALP